MDRLQSLKEDESESSEESSDEEDLEQNEPKIEAVEKAVTDFIDQETNLVQDESEYSDDENDVYDSKVVQSDPKPDSEAQVQDQVEPVRYFMSELSSKLGGSSNKPKNEKVPKVDPNPVKTEKDIQLEPL